MTLSQGDIVSHRTFGVGRVVAVAGDPPTELVIEFANKVSPRTMSAEVAARGLVRLPGNGLEALLLNDPETPRRWAREAPLKLLAAALTDLDGPASPSDLQHKIARAQVLGGKWETWWKRVQPAAKASTHFQVGLDGTYRLRSSPEDVPETPLVSPKKNQRPRLAEHELVDTVARLEAGELQFSTLGAENARAALRALMEKQLSTELVRLILSNAMVGPVPVIRSALDEVMKAQRSRDALEMLFQLISLLRQELRAPRDGRSPDGEYILARVKLIQRSSSKLPESFREERTLFVRHLMDLSLDLAPARGTSWRSEGIDIVLRTVLALGSMPPIFDEIASAVCSSDTGVEGRQAVLSTLAAQVLQRHGKDGLPRLIQPMLTMNCAELAERLLLSELDDKGRVLLVGAIASHMIANILPGLSSLARILETTRQQASPNVLAVRLNLALALASSSPLAGAILAALLEQDLLNVLDPSASVSEEGPAVRAIRSALTKILDRERSESERLRLEKEAETQDLTRRLATALQERGELQELTRQLQAGYRGSRDLTLLEGRRDVLSGLAALYQETFLARASNSLEAAVATWVLAKIETLLQLQGATRLAEVDTVEPFNPSRHEALNGHGLSVGQVRIACPGFECPGPGGGAVVLVRAKVVSA